MSNRPERFHELTRAKDIAQLRAYYKSIQYVGRPDWWTGKMGNGEVVPLRERAPCRIYPLPRIVVRQVVRFTFGEGRFPRIQVEEDEGRVSPDQAVELQKFIGKLVESCRVRPLVRNTMAKALSERTTVAVFGVRGGRIAVDLASADHCEPTFIRPNDPSSDVRSIVWCYQYDRDVEEAGVTKTKKFWFRRDIDDKNITDYEPTPVENGVVTVEWKSLPPVAHGFTFCPVLWIRNVPEPDAQAGDLDGVSIYDGLLSEVDALNFSLSQRHRGIHYFGTPQPWETGVAEDDGPEADGRTARPNYSNSKAPVAFDPKVARRMAPDYMWSYRGEHVNVGLVETTGKAFEATTKHVEDARGMFLEAVSVVFAHVQDFGAKEMSGRALALAFAPMLALIDELRDACWWPMGLASMITMMLRIVAEMDGKGLIIPGAEKIAPLLKSFTVETNDGKIWMPPSMIPVWGSYFPPSAEETAITVTSAIAAKTGGLIAKKTAAEYVADDFGVGDVEAELKEADTEAQEAQQNALENASALAEATGGPVKPDPKKAKK